MGIALDKLGEGRCKDIVRSLFTVKREDPAEGELFGLCPIHGEKPDTSSLSFSYNYKTDKYHCFSCGAGGDLASLWQEIQGPVRAKRASRPSARCLSYRPRWKTRSQA